LLGTTVAAQAATRSAAPTHSTASASSTAPASSTAAAPSTASTASGKPAAPATGTANGLAPLLGTFQIGNPLPTLPDCADKRTPDGRDVTAFCVELAGDGVMLQVGVPRDQRPA